MLDVNGTRSHALLTFGEWTAAVARADRRRRPGAEWDDALGALVLRRDLGVLHNSPGDEPAPDALRGAALAQDGTVYWIADGRDAILARLPGDGAVVQWWPDPPAVVDEDLADPAGWEPVAPAAPARLRLDGLALAAQLLLAGTAEGLLAFDLRSGHPPRALRWSADVGLRVTDMAERPGGGAAVLDASAGRLWLLDRALDLESPAAPGVSAADRVTFSALTAGGAGGGRPREPTARDAIAAPSAATCVNVATDDSLLVVCGNELVRLVGGEETGRVTLRGPGGAPVLPFLARAAAPPSGAVARLLVVPAAGDSVLSYVITVGVDGLAAALEPRLLPLRRFTGRGIAAAGDTVVYDSQATGWVDLVELRIARHAVRAQLVTAVLDGRDPGCVWHRVVLDAALPPGSRITVEALAADDPALVAGETPAETERLDWTPQPAPVAAAGDTLTPWSAPVAALTGLLLQGITGRYARLRLTLTGDGRVTPRLHELRVSYPRFSYRDHYLPTLYREDDRAAGFLDRYLANAEGLFTALEGTIATFQAALGATSAPDDALDWLAGWVDITLDPAFSERRRRLFVAHMVTLLAARGTPRGLQVALRLALDPAADERALLDPGDPRTGAIRIIEAYKLRHASAVAAGDPTGDPETRAGASRTKWRPSDGAAALDERWEAYAGEPQFPMRPPRHVDYQGFCDRQLGYRPGIPGVDDARWAAFVARRHGGAARAAAALGPAATALPTTLPTDLTTLTDWHDFGAVVIAADRFAHRFTVLLPICDGEDPIGPAALARRALAERVIALQKPAHTVAETRWYRAAFRIGLARLGEDTAVATQVRPYPLAVLEAALGEVRLGGRQLIDDTRCGCSPHDQPED